MPPRSIMTYRATIERDQSQDPGANPDDWGDAPVPVWTRTLDAVPCWVWTRMDRELAAGGGIVAVEDVRMIVPRGTDVTTRDRVLNVVDQRGRTIRTGPFIIDALANRRDHLELMLKAVS